MSRHPFNNPGFGQGQDPFDGLSRADRSEYDNNVLNFEDTYDGLGDQLDETGDDFNDDTFGGGAGGGSDPPGKDFDFFGHTAKVADAMTAEGLMYSRQQPAPKANVPPSPKKAASKPYKTGYEIYGDIPSHVTDLRVDHSLWGTAPSHPQQPPPQAIPSQRKMLSLEDIENEAEQRREQKRLELVHANQPKPSRGGAQVDLAREQGLQLPTAQVELPANTARTPQSLGRPPESKGHFPRGSMQGAQGPGQIPPVGPAQAPFPPGAPQPMRMPVPPGLPGHIITHPQQIMQLSEEERAAFLIEDAKRAKRNHKIFLLSKDNGLMTPQDKNFITRIQLQQLMAATGNVNEQDPDAAFAEDFYYQVYNQIRGGPRANPHQPLNHFAQTYLFQTGGRNNAINRRHARGGDNHVQRMEQQVQRAVEAAKLKPKNKQLIIDGSLGKISFSNAKTPKPLLNIRRHESGDLTNRPNSAGRQAGKELSISDRKVILKDIENVYSTLMSMEDEQRKEPPLPPGDPSPELIQQHMEWGQGMSALNQRLWDELKVMQPINQGSSIPHPFIAILSYAKGKKAIPRVFRHLTNEQHLTMLTMIVIHLDILDVVRLGHLQPGEMQLPTASREAIDLFSAVVTPSLFAYVSEAPMFNVIGLLGVILDHVNVPNIAKTRVGLSILTMLTSRATLVKDEGNVDKEKLDQWAHNYDRLFDMLEPILGSIFPGKVNSGEDMYVWQFLAAIGSGASPEQQQRLVIAVKDRVMETVSISKTLPADMASQRLGNVNLFMRAIGLDVELLG